MGTSQRPHHLYSLAKINKRDICITYYPTTNIQRGIRRILTAAYFSATKTGKLPLLQTNKNCKSFLSLNFYIVNLIKISTVNCLDERTIHADTILYLSLYYLINDWYTCHINQPYITPPIIKTTSLKQCSGR